MLPTVSSEYLLEKALKDGLNASGRRVAGSALKTFWRSIRGLTDEIFYCPCLERHSVETLAENLRLEMGHLRTLTAEVLPLNVDCIRASLFILNPRAGDVWNIGILEPVKPCQINFRNDKDSVTTWQVHDASTASRAFRESSAKTAVGKQLQNKFSGKKWVVSLPLKYKDGKNNISTPLGVISFDGSEVISEPDADKLGLILSQSVDGVTRLLQKCINSYISLVIEKGNR